MRQKRRSALGYGLLAALALAVLLWLWWRAGREFQQAKHAQPPNPPAHAGLPTNAQPPATSTNLADESRPKQATPSAPERPAPEPVLPKELPPLVQPPKPMTNQAVVTAPPPAPPTEYPRPVRDAFECQLALARQGLSPGSLDGTIGPQTRSALRAFQQREQLPVTGELDAATKAQLLLDEPPLTTYVVTAHDLARLQPLSRTWLGKSQQTALEYETILELVAEKAESHPALIRQLNPSLDWTRITAGTPVQIPLVGCPALEGHAASLVIRLSDKTLEAFDADGNLLAHFPCSIAQRVEKRPVGELHVAVIAPHPNYTFDPKVFPESAEARRLNVKLVLPPGPNNPVGVAWIGLDKPGYGIHGTPSPEQVGRTESHGCFRLANWNAEYLLRLVTVGTPVHVRP